MTDEAKPIRATPALTSAELAQLCHQASDAARVILTGREHILDGRARLRLASAFRRMLRPARRPGRKPKASITAACDDFKAGLRGTALYQKHIPGFDRMSRWRRCVESRKLREAIRSRLRRERKCLNPA